MSLIIHAQRAVDNKPAVQCIGRPMLVLDVGEEWKSGRCMVWWEGDERKRGGASIASIPCSPG